MASEASDTRPSDGTRATSSYLCSRGSQDRRSVMQSMYVRSKRKGGAAWPTDTEVSSPAVSTIAASVCLALLVACSSSDASDAPGGGGSGGSDGAGGAGAPGSGGGGGA